MSLLLSCKHAGCSLIDGAFWGVPIFTTESLSPGYVITCTDFCHEMPSRSHLLCQGLGSKGVGAFLTCFEDWGLRLTSVILNNGGASCDKDFGFPNHKPQIPVLDDCQDRPSAEGGSLASLPPLLWEATRQGTVLKVPKTLNPKP